MDSCDIGNIADVFSRISQDHASPRRGDSDILSALAAAEAESAALYRSLLERPLSSQTGSLLKKLRSAAQRRCEAFISEYYILTGELLRPEPDSRSLTCTPEKLRRLITLCRSAGTLCGEITGSDLRPLAAKVREEKRAEEAALKSLLSRLIRL